MRRVAAAVLLSVFLINTMIPGIVAPAIPFNDSAPLESNPGLQGDGALFDLFSQTVVIRAAPWKFATADLNNDARCDVAIIYQGSKVLDIFFANETFAFSSAPSHTITFNWQPTSLATGDMDRDTKVDLVVCLNYDSSENIVICYQKNNFSTISPQAKYLSNPQMQREVLVQDLNEDGWLDIIALYCKGEPDFPSGFAVYLSTTPNNYTHIPKSLPAEMYCPVMMTIGDLNGDGRRDLVIGDPTAKKVIGYRNDNVTGAAWTPIGPINDVIVTALLLEQLVGDGREELVMALAANPPLTTVPVIRVLRYSNSTTLIDEFVDDIRDQPAVTGLASTLNNGDGTLDLVRTSNLRHNITIFNTPAGAPIWRYADSISFPTPSDPSSVLSCDMNDDGRGDLVVLCGSSADHGTLNIYFHSALTISNANDNLVLNSFEASLAATGNFDGDRNDNGYPLDEIVLYNRSAHKAYFYRTSTAALGELDAPRDAVALTVADLNSDGMDELVWTNATSTVIWWGKTSFLTSISLTALSPSMPPRSLGFGDLNGDGRRELVVGCLGGLEVYWNSGTEASFSTTDRFVLTLEGSDVTAVKIGRLSGDGDALADLAIVNANSGRVEIYHQQASTPEFLGSARILLTIVPHLSNLIIADFNGDGRLDLATHSTATLYLFLQYPGGFSEAPEFPVRIVPGQGITELIAGNLDDRDIDELALVSGNSTLMVYHYAPSVGFKLMTIQTLGASPLAILTPDMNGDGKDDLVAYSTHSRAMSFFYQNNLPPVAQGQAEGSGFYEGDTIWFNANGSTDTLSDIDRLVYIWDFGDAVTASGKRVDHRFSDNGMYNVVLNVSDPWGGWNRTKVIIVVDDRSPVANFTIQSSPPPMEGASVRFDDHSTTFTDSIVLWEWNFGDGEKLNQTTGQSVYHTYAQNDTYLVVLTVVDIDNSTSSTSQVIVIDDSSPRAEFRVSTSSPMEGHEVFFTDTSKFTADDIVQWSWDLGDGTRTNRTDNATITHRYLDNGTYTVVLTVTDVDGDPNAYTYPVTVRDTTPIIALLRTSDGGSSYEEWDEINLVVVATPVHENIVKYQWDFETVSFQADDETTLNSTYHRYISSGTYKVTVRVWDSDSYDEKCIILTINDPAPIPEFTFAGTTNSREVNFSAALTTDTENDQPTLLYRWFFGDGNRTDWSSYFEVDHTYQQDGVYSVRLEVRDDHNSAVMKTKNVTIDLLPPEISIDAPVLRAVVGEPTLIKVRVTDLVGVRSVILEYTFENATRSVAMTPEGGGIYFAQVPAQNRTGELTYRVTAVDKAGHASSTEWFTVALEYEDPTLFIVTTALLLIALLIVIAYLVLTRPIVDEVFVMYQDGTLLAHQTRRLKPGMDDEILGGMLIALQSFVRDSFKDEGTTVLKRMDFGDRKLLVERKDGFFMAVVLSGKRAGNSAQRMRRVLDRIEERYADVLRDWDGDLEKVRGIRDETKLMFQRTNPLERLRRREGDEGST